MKLYRIEFGFSKRGRDFVGVVWEGTQAQAKERVKSLMAGAAYDVECDAVDFPTDKEGLLHWLNTHAGADAHDYPDLAAPNQEAEEEST